MPYMGKVDVKASDIKRFDVTGSTSATHTLSWTAPSEQSLIITINGVKQQDSAYTISGSPTTITLASALVATDEMEVIGINDIGQTNTVAQDSIVTDMIRDDAVTSAKLDTNITIDGTFDVGSYLSVDSSGRVTMPNQPAFQAAGDSTQNNQTGVVVSFSTTILNNGNHFSTSTNRFTAPVDGLYHFHFMGFADQSNTASGGIYIRKNGSNAWPNAASIRTYSSDLAGYAPPFPIQITVELAVNDYVDLYTEVGLHMTNGAFFGGYLIG